MIKHRSFFEKLIYILQGASWALVVVGATTSFLKLYSLGFVTALLGAFLGSLLGLFFVVLFEIAQIQIDKLNEMKKQTEILNKILDKFNTPQKEEDQI